MVEPWYIRFNDRMRMTMQMLQIDNFYTKRHARLFKTTTNPKRNYKTDKGNKVENGVLVLY